MALSSAGGQLAAPADPCTLWEGRRVQWRVSSPESGGAEDGWRWPCPTEHQTAVQASPCSQGSPAGFSNHSAG